MEDIGSPLYYAVYLRLEPVVHRLLSDGADPSAPGGWYGNALQVASRKGFMQLAEKLIKAGADVSARGGFYGDALQAAARGGHEKVRRSLLE